MHFIFAIKKYIQRINFLITVIFLLAFNVSYLDQQVRTEYRVYIADLLSNFEKII